MLSFQHDHCYVFSFLVVSLFLSPPSLSPLPTCKVSKTDTLILICFEDSEVQWGLVLNQDLLMTYTCASNSYVLISSPWKLYLWHLSLFIRLKIFFLSLPVSFFTLNLTSIYFLIYIILENTHRLKKTNDLTQNVLCEFVKQKSSFLFVLVSLSF